MNKITLLVGLLFTFQVSICQTKKGISVTKTMTMTFEEYSEGDYPHFLFKDTKTGAEYDFRHIGDNKLGTLPILLTDDNASFGLRANPKYLKKKFTVVAVKKLISDIDLDGKTMKVRDWVITSIKISN
jgi:hypothetical protein